jgi:hypothetical protein
VSNFVLNSSFEFKVEIVEKSDFNFDFKGLFTFAASEEILVKLCKEARFTSSVEHI